MVTHVVSSASLFVPWPKNHLGEPHSMRRLSHWIDEAIAIAYSSKLAVGLREHSTTGLGTSRQICVAASWVTPDTFTRFYCLDFTAPPSAQGVLTFSETTVETVSPQITSVQQSGSLKFPMRDKMNAMKENFRLLV